MGAMRWLARSSGLAAAALTTIAPFQVYYSQEARMHIWTTALGLLLANALVWYLGEGAPAAAC